MPKLARHINREALARAQLSCEGRAVPWPQSRSIARVKPHKSATTYRAARRNASRGSVWPGQRNRKSRHGSEAPLQNRAARWRGLPRINLWTAP